MILLNNQIGAYLMTGGTEDAPVWSSLGGAFKSIAQTMGENKYTAAYLNDGGFSSSEVTGLAYQLTLSGDYISGDPVVEYLFSNDVLFGVGDARKTKLRLVRDGNEIIWSVTMTKITENGGDANEPNGITLELCGNGKPTLTE